MLTAGDRRAALGREGNSDPEGGDILGVTPDNDPHKEHDFGSFALAERKFFLEKSNAYDADMRYGSEDRPTAEDDPRAHHHACGGSTDARLGYFIRRRAASAGQRCATYGKNLFFASFSTRPAIPIAAGALYPVFGCCFNPMIASAAMAMSSVTGIRQCPAPADRDPLML